MENSTRNGLKETDWQSIWGKWDFEYGPKTINFAVASWVWKRTLKSLLRDVSKKQSVLGLGSGTGLTSFIIAELLKSEELTLVDIEEGALRISKGLIKKLEFSGRVNYLKEDILNLSPVVEFRQGFLKKTQSPRSGSKFHYGVSLRSEFDVVHSEGLLEHFYQQERIEAFRRHVNFCRKGGIIIIFVPIKGLVYNLAKWINTLLDNWGYAEEPFSKEEIYGLCQKFDLKIIKEITQGHEMGFLLER